MSEIRPLTNDELNDYHEGVKIARLAYEANPTLNAIKIDDYLEQIGRLLATVDAAECRAEALVQATEQLIQASRSFRLAWIDQKCGIGIHHGHLEAAEQVAKRAIRGEVELPAQDRGEVRT